MFKRLVRAGAVTLLAWAGAVAGSLSVATAADKLAVFPFEIIIEDTMEGIPMANPAEKKRLEKITAETVQLLTESGQYRIVDNTPLAAEIDKQSPFFKCNGCDVDVAKKLDAALVLTGLVQKGSATTANISIGVRSVATGELVRTAGITVLENTDDGWVRGVRRLVKSRLIDGGDKK